MTEWFGAALSGRMTFLKKSGCGNELAGVEGCGSPLSWLRCWRGIQVVRAQASYWLCGCTFGGGSLEDDSGCGGSDHCFQGRLEQRKGRVKGSKGARGDSRIA